MGCKKLTQNLSFGCRPPLSGRVLDKNAGKALTQKILRIEQDDKSIETYNPCRCLGTPPTVPLRARATFQQEFVLSAAFRVPRPCLLTKPTLALAGPCNDMCECHASGNFCTKYCQCKLASCSNAFKGCRCSGLCDRKSCPCYLANRECDADICHCAGNVMGEPGGCTTCRSMALTRRVYKVRTKRGVHFCVRTTLRPIFPFSPPLC